MTQPLSAILVGLYLVRSRSSRPLPRGYTGNVAHPSRSIPEFGGRVLRVAVNKAVERNRVVSVFFDRKMKGKL